MTDYTPEPWETQEMPSEIDCRERGDWIMLSGPDWFRARACVNACAGIPTEQLGSVARLLNASENFLIAVGMGWDLEGVHQELVAALAPFRKD